MQRTLFRVLPLVMAASAPLTAAEKASPIVTELARKTLAPLGTDAAVIEAVRRENAKSKTLEAIKSLDDRWRKTPGVADFMRELLDNACAKRLKDFARTAPYVVEMFVTDNQGANVCMTNKTSDYWQGDEDKFIKSFAGKTGTIFVDDVKFDESAQAYVSQVSVPVLDGGKLVGVLVVGVSVEQLK